jgi:hypothetical protein
VEDCLHGPPREKLRDFLRQLEGEAYRIFRERLDENVNNSNSTRWRKENSPVRLAGMQRQFDQGQLTLACGSHAHEEEAISKLVDAPAVQQQVWGGEIQRRRQRGSNRDMHGRTWNYVFESCTHRSA